MTYSDLMIDIETLDIRPTAKIIQMGACLFNANNAEIEPKLFLRNVICDDYSFSENQSTKDWWSIQGKDAQDSLKHPSPIGINKVMIGLEIFIRNRAPNFERVWVQGSDFDFPIIKHACAIKQRSVPWQYYMQRDSRTLMKTFPNVDRVEPKIKHRADYDALAQAQTIQNIYKHIAKLRGDV